MAKGRESDSLENPYLCKHRACATVVGTRPADLPLGPAINAPHEEAGEMTATDHESHYEGKMLLLGRRRSDAQV